LTDNQAVLHNRQGRVSDSVQPIRAARSQIQEPPALPGIR
jgi:hypothetical protein